MRFWCTYSKTMKRQLFILTLKNNNWTARLFEKTYFQKDTLLEIKINQNDLLELWKKLKENNVLNIPNESELRDKSGKEIYA